MGGFGALLLSGLFVAASYSIAAAAAGLGTLIHDSAWPDAFADVRRDPVLLALAQLGGASVAIGIGVMVHHGNDARWRHALGVRPTPSVIAALAIGAGIGLALPLHEIGSLVFELAPALAPDPTAARAFADLIRIDGLRTAIVVPLAFVAVPAISEELLFRGLILPGLAERYGRRIAIWGSALLFGAIHLDPLTFVQATAAGLVLGWVRLRVDSVLPAIALHGAVNAVPIALPAELVRLPGFNTAPDGVHHLPLALVLGSLATTLLFLYAVARLSEDE